jgi:hypothetical protein
LHGDFSVLNEDVMRRLIFIRYVYGLGMEQSRHAQPHASVAILMLHDCVELFLHLATEHHKVEVGKKPLEFADYFGRLEASPPGPALTGKASLLRLNQARVGLKHHANLPDEVTISELCSRVGIFFEDNTPLIFGIGFEAISLLDLVTCAEARTSLERASAFADKGHWSEAMGHVAVAFAYLLADSDSRSRGHAAFSPTYSPFDLGGSLPLDGGRGNDDMQEVVFSVAALKTAVKVMGMGLDYRHYAKFIMLTPSVWQAPDGTIRFNKASGWGGSEAAYTYCRDYVIESALKLQSFEFAAK